MAENGNRGSNESFRRNQGMRKRREPPIIDATATDISPPERQADEPATEPPSETPAGASEATASEVLTGEPAEPVLFGNTARDVPATDEGGAKLSDEAAPPSDHVTDSRAEELPVETALGAPIVLGETVVGDDDKTVDTAAVADAPSGEAPETGYGNGNTPPPTAPRRTTLPMVLGAVVLVLLVAIAGLLYNASQRTGSGDLSATVDTLSQKVAALEARPASAPDGAQITALDGKTTSLANDVAALRSAVADLGGKVEAATRQAQGDAGRITALEQKAGEAQQPAAASGANPPATTGDAQGAPVPAFATAADLSALAAKVDDLAKRVAALPTEASTAGATPPVENGSAGGTLAPAADLGPMQGKLADLSGRLDALQAGVAAIPRIDLAPVEARLDTLDHRLAESDKRMTALSAGVAALPKVDLAPLQTAISDLDKRVAPIEAVLSAPKAPDRVTEARAVGDADIANAAPLAVVAQSLSRAIDEGRPYGAEMDALKTLGVDDAALAPLGGLAGQGAPTLEALKTQWLGVEHEVLAAVRPKGDSVLDRFAAGARNLVQIRPVGAGVVGEDPASITGRIDAALDRGDLAAALADWAKLPETGRAVSQAWADTARARLDAGTAAQGLVSRAIGMLGKAKG